MLILVAVGCPAVQGETWTHKGFEQLIQGHFEDGGSNAYVSARGRIQLINRLDLNNDGHLDLFVGNGHGHTENEDAFIYLNNGEEIDPLRRIALPADSAIHGLVEDLDGDGRNDLVMVNTTGGITSKTATYLYYGSEGGFSVQKRVRLKAWTGKAAAASDWNGDGRTDLAIACANLNPSTGKKDLSVLYWNGPEGFDESRKSDLPGVGLFALAADMNGDGLTDLVLAHPEQIKIYWASERGLGFGAPSTLSVSAQHLASGDFDGDGYSELLAVTEGGVRVLPGSPKGPVVKGGQLLEVPEPSQTAVADFNRDGSLDLAVSRRHQMGNEYTDSLVFWNRQGSFDRDHATALPTVNATGISAGDLNADGWPDLVISNFGSLNNLSIQSFVYWNQAGEFHFARKSMLDTRGAQGNCIGDVDNDGRPDLVFFNFEGGLRSGYSPNFIYWGDGTRNFSIDRQTSLWSVYNVGTIQADLDDDGWVDLGSVEARYASRRPITLHGVYLWYGSPAGYGEDQRLVLSVEDPESGGHTADLNRDGYLDLIIGAAEEGADGRKGYVILYGGAKGFSPNRRQVIPLGVFGRPPLIADLNRDGYLDLAGGSYQGGLYLTYGSAEGFRVDDIWTTLMDQRVAKLDAADFDRDGWLDLVVPAIDYPDNKETDVLIYYGSGDGFAERRVVRLPHLGGTDVSVADFNRDGDLDLFVANYAGNYKRSVPSYLYFGSPSGFDPKRRQELPGNSAAASIAADFDGDSWIDLFVVNHKRDGSRDRPGDPIDHRTPSFLYWNGPSGFSPDRKTELPTVGPHGQITRDPGNIYTREMAEVYVSPPHHSTMGAREVASVHWRAETPFGSEVLLQVRTAESPQGLEGVEWRGPNGPASWFRKQGTIPSGAGPGPWFQYRARLTTPDGGASPVLTEVTLELE